MRDRAVRKGRRRSEGPANSDEEREDADDDEFDPVRETQWWQQTDTASEGDAMEVGEDQSDEEDNSTTTAEGATGMPTSHQNHQQTTTALKARVKRTEDNPSVAMLEKDPRLLERWKPSLRKELNGMKEKGAVYRITKEEALAIGVTGHVTTMTLKRQGEGHEKSRININGAEELRNDVFEDRRALYAPALGEEGFHFLMAMAAYYDMTMYRSDVNQAFMYNDMNDAIVKRDIVIKLAEVECGIKGGAYYQYDKLGYGAADASAAWAGQMTRFLQIEGQLQPSQQLMCIYVRLIGERGLILVGVATDDIIQIGTRDRETQQELRNLRDQMDKKWTMTHSELITALGVQVQRNQDGSITLTQPAQIGKIQSKFFPTGEVPETYAPGRKGQDRDEDFDAKVDSTDQRRYW